jgi:hypothetical protein
LNCFPKTKDESGAQVGEKDGESEHQPPDGATDNSVAEASPLAALIWGSKPGFWFEIENVPTYSNLEPKVFG